jgi:hypothetical protein
MYSYYNDVNDGEPCVASSDIALPDLREPYQQLILSAETPFSARDAAGFAFAVADYNGDGTPDLLCLKKNTRTGSLEIQVLSHASNYQQLILRAETPLDGLDAASFAFAVADYNGDGTPDLLGLKKNTEARRVEIQVLSHASNYQQLTQLSMTPFGAADPAAFHFAVADYNGDGTPDLLCLMKNTEARRLDVQVLRHASNYQQLTRLTGTPLNRLTGIPLGAADAAAADAAAAAIFHFAAADYSGDGTPDLFCLKNTGTGRLEVLVLSGAPYFS